MPTLGTKPMEQMKVVPPSPEKHSHGLVAFGLKGRVS
jgi:hypothetical protein